MDYRDYSAQLLEHRRVARVEVVARLREGDDDYPMLRVTVPGAHTLLVTAGFHGDEVAGPLTLLAYLPEIIDHARSRGVGLSIYPCLNPSGFSDGTRYNRAEEWPNNDLLRYELRPGVWAGELTAGQTFLRHAVHREGPKETRALAAELEGAPTPAGALDLHQDPWLGGASTYAYTFGPSAPYLPLVAASERHLAVVRGIEVDDGVFTAPDGLIELHDGSVTDYMFRRGVPFTAALETTTAAPLDACHRVNLIWIRGFIDLCAGT
jgi:hypothetical protein